MIPFIARHNTPYQHPLLRPSHDRLSLRTFPHLSSHLSSPPSSHTASHLSRNLSSHALSHLSAHLSSHSFSYLVAQLDSQLPLPIPFTHTHTPPSNLPSPCSPSTLQVGNLARETLVRLHTERKEYPFALISARALASSTGSSSSPKATLYKVR